MRQLFISFVAVVWLATSMSEALADNRLSIYAGGSISHLFEDNWVDMKNETYNWGGGALIGTSYEIGLSRHWSIMPAIEVRYDNNGATNKRQKDKYGYNSCWMDTWSIQIPVTVNFRLPVSDNVSLRIGAGPYLQEALYSRRFKTGSDVKERMHGTFANRFNVGFAGEAAVETGQHLSYIFQTRYPFLSEGWIRKTLTLSIGIKYTF